MIRSFLVISLLFLSTVACAQTPIPPLRLQSGSQEPAITVTVTGVEFVPTNIVARWDNSSGCFARLECFVASLVAANRAGDVARMRELWVTNERAEFDRDMRSEATLGNNTRMFQDLEFFGLIGWIDYSEHRFLLLVRRTQRATTTHVVTVRREGSRWGQTNDLRDNFEALMIAQKFAEDVLRRHPLSP